MLNNIVRVILWGKEVGSLYWEDRRKRAVFKGQTRHRTGRHENGAGKPAPIRGRPVPAPISGTEQLTVYFRQQTKPKGITLP